MKLLRKLLAPALLLSSVFGGAAMAQQKAELPDAPAPQQTQSIYTRPQMDFSAPPARAADNDWMPGGTIGRLAGYFDRHSNESQAPFDFAMEYRLKGRFSVMAGTVVDMRTHGGKEWSDRFMLRQMTGLPDWQTQGLRNMMGDTMPGRGLRGGDGFAAGIRIDLGRKR